MARQLEAYQLIERSIIKKYRKEIWNPFIEAVKTYHLINENDKINCVVVNSKKSVLCAKLLQQLKRVSETEFEIEFICDSQISEKFNIPSVEEFSDKGKSVGLVCFTDVVQRVLKSVLQEGKASSYLPREGNEINPLFCIRDEAINAWVRYNGLEFPNDDEERITLTELTPEVEHSIFKSVHAVCLDTIPAYVTDNKKHTFLEEY